MRTHLQPAATSGIPKANKWVWVPDRSCLLRFKDNIRFGFGQLKGDARRKRLEKELRGYLY